MRKRVAGSMLLLTAIFLAACDGSNAPTNRNSPSESGEKSEAIPPNVIGETVAMKELEFTLTSIREAKKVTASSLADSAGPGEVFVVAKFSFKNTGAKPVEPMYLPTVDLVDGKGTVYSSDIANSAFAQDEGGGTGLDGVNPGIVYKDAAAWRLAEGSFDTATWKIIVRASPELEFKLK
jgi:Domain of unknown function (DUF4352)